MDKKVKDIMIILSYILIGVLTRTVFHIAPNVEFVTALTFAGAYFIKNRYSFTIPFAIMIISDLIIGNTSIFIFTWSAYMIAWAFGRVLRSKKVEEIIKGLPKLARILTVSEFSAVFFTLCFYLWTNFGVVVVSSMYPKTIAGLLLSYKIGLPFLIPQLVGNMIIVPGIFLVTYLVYKLDYKQLSSGKLCLLDG